MGKWSRNRSDTFIYIMFKINFLPLKKHIWYLLLQTEPRGFSQLANYTDRATAACRGTA
jgi:hypothetical protein